MPEWPGRPLLNILFVCLGNACRSQIAEAVASKLGEGKIRAWSAGSAPLGRIIPETYEVLKEKGISLDGHRSKGLADVPMKDMDVVVGMGCEVNCPVPGGFRGRVIEWNIPDPYGRELDYFRSIRDLIERQVAALLEQLGLSPAMRDEEAPSPEAGERARSRR